MEIFLYAFSVMYSPGPVNIMGLNSGLTGQFSKTIGFFIGVGLAMFSLFIVFGYTGQAIISTRFLPYIALIGSLYTMYLAFKIAFSKVDLNDVSDKSEQRRLTLRDGFLIQALNPKGMLVVLPITTVMFPAAHITGSLILFLSLLIAIGGAGAPGIYSFLGAVIGKRISNEAYFTGFNRCMGAMLFVSAIYMFKDFIAGVHFNF